MSLRDDVAVEMQPKPRKCGMQAVRKQLPADEATEFTAMVADESLPLAAIARALAARGISITAMTLGRHRRKECAACR